MFHGRETSEKALAACEGQGGTVYLHEVGDLPPAAQKEVLRQISLGDAERNHVARYICGSSCELEPEVRSGKVHEDLYYRISGVCLRLPPLRQRKEDIPGLRTGFFRFSRRISIDLCQRSAPRRKASFSSTTGPATFANSRMPRGQLSQWEMKHLPWEDFVLC